MSNCSDNKNPLQHSGTSQAERLLPGLQADYVKVNEKDYDDWIVFAASFAEFLTYYDSTNTATGNWQPFFTNDIAALLGSFAVQDIDVYRRAIKDRFDFIKDDANAANINDVKKKLHELFSILLSLSKALDNYLAKLPDKDVDEDNIIPLKNTLQNAVQSKLAPALQRLIAYYKAASAQSLLVTGDFTGLKVLNTQVVAAETIINGTGLSANWLRNGATTWSAYITSIAADDSVLGSNAWTEYRRLNHLANHNLFSSIFDQYTRNYAKLIKEAEAGLLTTLSNWSTHPPHYALFLSFLKLFKLAQANINTITQKHLDFYYKEVLQLLPKAAEPNQAHILVELAKSMDDYALTEGAQLKAGKDSTGKEVLYALDKETTFNKAKVALLKSVYKGDADGKDNHPLASNPLTTVNNVNRLFAAPVTNSDDGLGAALTSPNKEWHPYVDKKFDEAQLIDIVTPNASIGFAVASHYLYLTEGERKLTIRLAAGSSNAALYNKSFDCYLTTEKGWLQIPSTGLTAIAAGTMSNSTACAEFTVTLAGDAPAITNYAAAVHGGTLNVQLPVLKMMLKNTDDAVCQYQDMRNIIIAAAEIKVQAGEMNAYSQTGLKQLLLANDVGPIDASKPFQPFGSLPVPGNRLVIGNKEVFTKKQADVRINIEWKDVTSISYWDVAYGSQPDGGQLPNAAIRFLKNGIWETWVAFEEIFSAGTYIDPTIILPSVQTGLSDDTIVPYQDDYGVYNINSNKGYAAIQLTEGFGHKAYQDALTAYLIGQSKTPATGTKPTEPYTPVIQSIYLSYTASKYESLNSATQTTFDSKDIHLFHLYPFGEAEQDTWLTGKDVNLLPQFNHTEGSTTVDHIGELYMGVQQLHGQQSVNILFQVMEGTADPLAIKPADHIHWSYLAGNLWKDFDTNTIGDATRQLVQSSIITFIIPADATTDHTILPTGYIWLRAAVAQSAEAVCKLLTIDAQAALTTFFPNNNADDFLEKALPAATISKLKIPDASVKKITQPYASYGGRPKEQSDKFYIRVSERLRHKNRAITIWDYEHLVLENFPQIYKAKCLNHTKLVENTTTHQMEYNEVAPGYVTIITIPDLQNRNDTNPLKPYTNQNTLLDIEDFLKQKISCHVSLGVRNPQFEEVRMKFRLRLITGFNDFTFYREKLQQEITQFLTPWAFSGDAAISFGGTVYKSVLIDFIEERPYVDFITDVEMYQKVDDTTPESGDLDEITASTARSILVSAQASKHDIIEIVPEDVTAGTECSSAKA